MKKDIDELKEKVLTHALKDGKLIHIDRVSNGNECGCICPYCKGKLCAKNDGTYKVHHFAHQSGDDCGHAIESALHLMAKDVMQETLCIQLPDRQDGSRGEQLKLDKIEVEFHDKDTNLRPDCIGYYGDEVLWIEFKRTHAVDAKKRGKIISSKIDCVELDINGCKLDSDIVRRFITQEKQKRNWIVDTTTNSTQTNLSSNHNDKYAYGKQSEYDLAIRVYAKDENNSLVNLNKDEVNMNEHKYFCLACGTELTIDVNQNGIYSFVHLDSNIDCKDSHYAYKAAKEIIWHKFMSSDKFEIMVPQKLKCEDNQKCVLYNARECYTKKKVCHNLKEHGYSECLKDVEIPELKEKCDLLIKRADSMKTAIFININTGYNNFDITKVEGRSIEINVLDGKKLKSLQDEPLGTTVGTIFRNFNKETNKIASSSEMSSRIFRFQLFSSGKYHLDEPYCSDIKDRKQTTILEYLFSQNIGSEYIAKCYALLKCYDQKRKVCFCEICEEFSAVDNTCKCHNKKGTPRFPLKEWKMNCPHFWINSWLESNIKGYYDNVQVIENIIK